MEGAAANAIDTALLEAKLALPIVLDGQVIGAMGVSSGDGERCAQAAIDAAFKGR